MSNKPQQQPQREDEAIVSSAQLTVQSRKGKDGVEWRATYSYKRGIDQHKAEMKWALRHLFLADFMVFKRQFDAAVLEGAGRPH
jgi:hypothetical protein